jgi:hypothetical protein
MLLVARRRWAVPVRRRYSYAAPNLSQFRRTGRAPLHAPHAGSQVSPGARRRPDTVCKSVSAQKIVVRISARGSASRSGSAPSTSSGRLSIGSNGPSWGQRSPAGGDPNFVRQTLARNTVVAADHLDLERLAQPGAGIAGLQRVDVPPIATRDVPSGRTMFEGRTLSLRVVPLLSRLVTEGRRAGSVGRVLLQWHPDRRRQVERRPGSGSAGGLVVVRYDGGVHGAAQELRCAPRPCVAKDVTEVQWRDV